MNHYGGIDGFLSYVSLFPQENLGLVMLTNCFSVASADDISGILLTNSLAKEIFDSLLELKKESRVEQALEKYRESQKNEADGEQKLEEERVQDTQPSHKIEDYVGVYEHPGYGAMRIQLSDGQLSSVYNNIFTSLTHWHYDTFSGTKDQVEYPVFKGVKFTFQTGSGGNIIALSVPMEPKVNDIVFKRKADEQLSSSESRGD